MRTHQHLMETQLPSAENGNGELTHHPGPPFLKLSVRPGRGGGCFTAGLSASLHPRHCARMCIGWGVLLGRVHPTEEQRWMLNQLREGIFSMRSLGAKSSLTLCSAPNSPAGCLTHPSLRASQNQTAHLYSPSPSCTHPLPLSVTERWWPWKYISSQCCPKHTVLGWDQCISLLLRRKGGKTTLLGEGDKEASLWLQKMGIVTSKISLYTTAPLSSGTPGHCQSAFQWGVSLVTMATPSSYPVLKSSNHFQVCWWKSVILTIRMPR